VDPTFPELAVYRLVGAALLLIGVALLIWRKKYQLYVERFFGQRTHGLLTIYLYVLTPITVMGFGVLFLLVLSPKP